MSTDFKNKYNFLNDEFWQDFIVKNYKNPLDKLLFSLNQKIDKLLLQKKLANYHYKTYFSYLV